MTPATLLIVEDQAAVGADLEERLTRYGYKVCGVVGSGEEALALARLHRPELALMDIRIQGDMDGTEVAETLRRELDVAVIFLSAHSDAVTLQRAKASAPYGFLIKPFDEHELHLNIELALSKREGERRLAAIHEDLRRVNKALEVLAEHDPLTGLANRRKFAERLQYEAARAARNNTPLTIFMIDIDNFKEVNDQHGHLAGDSCLRALAAVLQAQLRAIDLLARFGGDEFVALLPDTPSHMALVVGERLRRQVGAHAIANGEGRAPLHITISIGSATIVGGAAKDVDEVLRHADEALYSAKQMGRNQLCTFPGPAPGVPAPA